MNASRHVSAAALILAGVISCQAQSGSAFPPADRELFLLLRKNPDQVLFRDAQRVEVVNARYERCTRKKDARCLRTITPTTGGYAVRVVRPSGQVMMEGTSSDPEGLVPHGHYRYYDAVGTLRAEGNYFRGVKTGSWQRYDIRGKALSPREYDGLDWEGRQVKMGLASRSRQLEDIAREQP